MDAIDFVAIAIAQTRRAQPSRTTSTRRSVLNVSFALCIAISRFLYLPIRCVLIQALTCCVTEREEQRRRGRERRAPEFVRSCGCALFFLHQSDKWHNEATSLNVREPSVALPVGLCRRQKGETREEGGHILDMFALSYLSLPSRKGVQHYLFCGNKKPRQLTGFYFCLFFTVLGRRILSR